MCFNEHCRPTTRFPCPQTDAENDIRRPNDGSYGDDGPSTLAYMVHFEDEDWYGYPYCPGCVLGIEAVEKCRCDPNDRDEFCVCIIDCVPEIKIRDMLMVTKDDVCVGCGTHFMRTGFAL